VTQHFTVVEDIDSVVAAVECLDRSARWRIAAAYPLEFAAFHPQGLARVGDRLLLSSAELLGDAEPYPSADIGYSGHGRGHVFELDMTGRLLREIVVGEGEIFHPGGISYDGRQVWVPAAEYRPDSSSIVYRLDPGTMTIDEVFRFDDHIGAIAHDWLTGLLHAATWGSARLLVLDTTGKMLRSSVNKSRFVDYQDYAAVGHGKLVCTGVTEYPLPSGEKFSLGGIGVVDMATGLIHHETPVTLLSPAGRTVTFNAVHLEVLSDPARLRMYAVPDDSPTPAGGSTLLVVDAPLD